MVYKESVSVTALRESFQCYYFVIWNVYTEWISFINTVVQLRNIFNSISILFQGWNTKTTCYCLLVEKNENTRFIEKEM